MPCAIWGTEAQTLEKGGDFELFDSPRAGGQYKISGTAAAELVSFNNSAKALLTTWLCDQRRAGVAIPEIKSNALEFTRSRRALTVPQRLTRALMFVGANVHGLQDHLSIGTPAPTTQRMFAETETTINGDATRLLMMLRDTGYLEGSFTLSGPASVRPTADGWKELERLTIRQTDSSQAFVAMWFHQAVEDAYINGIDPAITGMGFKPMRIDQKEHNNKIDDEIIAEIRRSRFVVADFTCEKEKPRGGVYYEAGFAHGLGLPVIWTCKDTSMNDLHFDTRQYAHIVWTTPDDLREKLKNRIGATIGDGPMPKS